MIRRQENPVPTAARMSSSEYEAVVAAFIRSNGVTRCPTACLVPTQASVPAADRAALEQYEAGRAQLRRANLAATAKLLGVAAPQTETRLSDFWTLPSRQPQTTQSRRSVAISVSS